MSQEGQAQPFDEEAALAELERLRESIQAARQARQRTSEQFDAFIKSFRTPAPTPASESASASESINPSLQAPDPRPSTVAVPSNTDSFGERSVLPASQIPQRYRLSIRWLGMLIIIAVIALGLVSSRRRTGISPSRTVTAVSDKAASTRSGGVSPPAASQSTSETRAAPGVTIELRVVRPVWMRVVIDGRKDVEGTVQAGDPMHLTGEHSIVVRVGNGGDVLVRAGAREESFGDTGQPRTRTFSKP